jgi:thioredoxin-like negative regulator of GroEL
MRCPKCGAQHDTAPSCARCGIVIAKYHVSTPPRRVFSPAPADPAAETRRHVPLDLVVLGMTLVGFTIYWTRSHSEVRVTDTGVSPAADRTRPIASSGRISQQSNPQESDSNPAEGSDAEARMPDVTAPCPIAGGTAPSSDRAVPPYWLEGASGYDDGVRAHDQRTAPMVLYFFTDWCKYCKSFDEQLLSSTEMDRYFSRQTVRVRINPERGPAEKGLADRFNVDGYPTFLLVPAGGATAVECSPYSPHSASQQLLSPAEFAQEIDTKNRKQVKELLSDAQRQRRAGNLPGALAILDKAAAASPDQADVYQERASALEQSGDLDRALSDYATLAALRPDDVAPYERGTRALLGARRFEEAAACSTDWVGYHPRSAAGYFARAEAHRGRGDPVAARADAQAACRLGMVAACH